MPYFRVHYSANQCGTEVSEVVEANSEEAAIDAYVDTALDWFWQFNSEDDIAIEPELDIWAEEISEADFNEES